MNSYNNDIGGKNFYFLCDIFLEREKMKVIVNYSQYVQCFLFFRGKIYNLFFKVQYLWVKKKKNEFPTENLKSDNYYCIVNKGI